MILIFADDFCIVYEHISGDVRIVMFLAMGFGGTMGSVHGESAG